MTQQLKTVHSNLKTKLEASNSRDEFKEVLHRFIQGEIDGEIIEIDQLFSIREQPKYRALFIELVKELIDENYDVEFNNSFTKIRKV